MNFVTDKIAYEKARKLLSKCIKEDKSFPHKVFRENLTHYAFINFDDIFRKDFYELLSRSAKSDDFVFSVLNPEPESYFHFHFDMYGMIEGNTSEGVEEYIRILNLDPGGSPADALGINSNVVALFGHQGNWAVYGERDWDIAVIASNNEKFIESAMECDRLCFFELNELFHFKDVFEEDVLKKTFLYEYS